MKTIRLFGYCLHISFRLSISKTITVAIPDKSDDVHIDDGALYYYRASAKLYIPLPKAKKHTLLHVTPLYDRLKKSYSSDRKVIIQLTF